MQASKLFVGNLAYSVSKEQLQELFAAHGQVQSVVIIEGKGFGFVEMSSPAEAEEAKTKLNGTDLQGRSLRIDEANPPKKDGGGFRRGGDRGGDRDFRSRY